MSDATYHDFYERSLRRIPSKRGTSKRNVPRETFGPSPTTRILILRDADNSVVNPTPVFRTAVGAVRCVSSRVLDSFCGTGSGLAVYVQWYVHDPSLVLLLPGFISATHVKIKDAPLGVTGA